MDLMSDAPAGKGQMTARSALALVSIATVVLTVVPYALNHRFYFNDDLEQQYVPLFRRVGEALLAGEWLTLTLDSWLGGNVFLDPQFGIANPVNLASYAFLARVDDLAVGLLVLA